MTDTVQLNKAIKESGLKKNFICSYLGVSRFTLNSRLTNKTRFNVNEVNALCTLLSISDLQKHNIFFKTFVDNSSTDSI